MEPSCPRRGPRRGELAAPPSDVWLPRLLILPQSHNRLVGGGEKRGWELPAGSGRRSEARSQALVDQRVVEQVEMGQRAYMHDRLGRDGDGAGAVAPGGAVGAYQEVSGDPAQRVRRVARDERRDEHMCASVQERDRGAAVVEEPLRVFGAPFVPQQIAMTQVADA